MSQFPSASSHGAPSASSQLSSRAASLQWGASAAEWSTGHADCCDDCAICCKGCWCPCVLHGDIKEHVTGTRPEGGCYTCLCIIQSVFCCFWFNCTNCTTCCLGKPLRKQLRQMYGLHKKNACCGSDCCTHWCCHCCSQCQEAREIDFRGTALNSTLAGHSKSGEVMMHTPMQSAIVMVPPSQQQFPQGSNAIANDGPGGQSPQISIQNVVLPALEGPQVV